MDNRFHDLIEVIRQRFDCDAQWLRSEHVREEMQGGTVWEGNVQIFAIKGHPVVETAYAWSYQNEQGHKRVVAVLNEGELRSASDAVRASLATEFQQGARQSEH